MVVMDLPASEVDMSIQKALALTVPDTSTLFSAYMPFLERGGLFVPTKTPYALGDQVTLLLTLPGECERLTVSGDVVWVSPDEISSQRVAGIGVHFSFKDSALREHIEMLLEADDHTAPSLTL